MVWLSSFFTLLISYVLTWVIRKYAHTNHLIDIPNHRSSHVLPTPRGGGLAFVISFMLLVSLAFFCQKLNYVTFCSLIIPGALVAFIGFMDDRGNVSAKNRLIVHFLAAGLAVYFIGGMPSLFLFNWQIPSGIIINALVVIYLVWLLNLYNFMDGIDGLAASEAVFVCFSAAFIYYLQGHFDAALLPIILGSSAAGFLIWNFPPARIFMGDAGSGFLGIILGVFSVQSAIINPQYFWCWLVLLGVFIIDATATLLQRAINKEKLTDAHCSHAYQKASRYYGKHLTVTVAITLINLLWLLPLALLIAFQFINGIMGLLIAYIPLIILALKFQAGKK